jgi:sortase B
LYDTGEKIKKKDKLLTLSTCEKASDNSRMVVVCKKSKINDR